MYTYTKHQPFHAEKTSFEFKSLSADDSNFGGIDIRDAHYFLNFDGNYKELRFSTH